MNSITTKHTEEVKMSNQTSVEWLIECLSIHLTEEQKMQFEGLFQQAQHMHKEEILDAYDNVMDDEEGNILSGEEYYQETFGNKQ